MIMIINFFYCNLQIHMYIIALLCVCSCKDLKDLNSFFAIVFGIMNGAVYRLKTTWEVSHNVTYMHSVCMLINFTVESSYKTKKKIWIIWNINSKNL